MEDETVSWIARIEAWPANAPLEAPYLMAPGTVAGICRTIVRVTTADGVVGLGESASPVDAVRVAAPDRGSSAATRTMRAPSSSPESSLFPGIAPTGRC